MSNELYIKLLEEFARDGCDVYRYCSRCPFNDYGTGDSNINSSCYFINLDPRWDVMCKSEPVPEVVKIVAGKVLSDILFNIIEDGDDDR